MAKISVTPEQLRSQAQTYTTKADEISQILNALDSLNDMIADEWDGAAFKSFLAEFKSTHSKNLTAVSEALIDVKSRIDQAAQNFEDQDSSNAQMFN